MVYADFQVKQQKIDIKAHRFLALNDKYASVSIGSKVFENNKIIIIRALDCLVEITK